MTTVALRDDHCCRPSPGDETRCPTGSHASGLDGTYTCELQLAHGATVAAGVVTVYNGTGDWAHTVTVPGIQLQRATLVSSRGLTVATAIFS
jgi:hypothetical protein